MEDLLSLLNTDPDKVISAIRAKTKKTEDIDNFKKEYYDHDRTIRDSQVGKLQADKQVGPEGKKRLVKAVRIPINFAKKIVKTASAFEVGKPVTLIPSEENDLSKLITQIWKVNRIDSLIQKLINLKKSETQGAMQFYISDLVPTSLLNKILTKIGLKSQAKEIKVKLLDNTTGIMTPYFDSTGNMIAFMWEYDSQNNDKTVKNVEIWDKDNYHYLNNESGKMAYPNNPQKHGFDRIPIVYVSQDEPEWFDVKELIDRFETTLSKLGGSNDYTAYPLLQIFGELESFPEKDDNGKVLSFPIKIDEDGKPIHGKAEFLTADTAAESQKLELNTLESLIYAISHTPNLSFDNVKGITGISGIALKLMFLDAMIKASMNEGDNRTMIERIINVFIGGIITTTNTNLSKLGESLFYDVHFNSILPDDLKELVETATSAISGGIMSKKTGIGVIAMTQNNEEELQQIEKEQKQNQPAAV